MMQVSEMASAIVWLLTALIILATVCVGVFKRILGDTIPFSREPRDFLLGRLARYGDPFTISLMGKTQTIVSSPEAIKFILSTAHTSFPDAYPGQTDRLLGRKMYEDGRHPHFRRLILSAVFGDGLQKLVPFISSLAEKTVKSWENQAVVDSVEELAKFVFNVSMHIIWRDVEPGSEEMDQIRNEVCIVTEGLTALPINFPGFAYHKALKAKQVLISRIQREISRRRKAGIQQDDILNAFMSMREVEVPDNDICCVMLSMMFAASESSAALLSWVLKYLEDFPEARQRVQIIYEVLRIEFFVIIPRKANKDIDYKGQVFRKDSRVWATPTTLHYDPKYHPNPCTFDPSRFDGKPNPNTFLPFGQGPHLCPGSDLALTETMFIIHHLVTNYSWKRYGHDEGVKQLPIRKLASFPISLIKRSTK